MSFAIVAVMNNKFPCGGGRVIPLPLDFGTLDVQNINLMQPAQNAQISDIQAFFIDNADNAAPLTLKGGAVQQRVVIPAHSQAWVNMLLDEQPVLQASTTHAAGLVVTIFAVNFPTTNAVWLTQ